MHIKHVSNVIPIFFNNLPQIAKSESENRGLVKFNDLVEEGKKKFQRELESLMPDVKPGKGQRVCVKLFVVLHTYSWKYFIDMEKSPLPVKGRKM